MTIVVSPATLYQPGTTVTEDVFGDSDGTITGTALAQTLVFDATGIGVSGDAETIAGTGRGGDDRFTVRGVDATAALTVFGDASSGLLESAQGGHDRITASGNVNVFGDGLFLVDQSLGGNDRIQLGGLGLGFGDGFALSGEAQGGDDLMFGNGLIGDALVLELEAEGGDDRLFGRGAAAQLFGDGIVMDDDARGGNDFVIANDRKSGLYGDAVEMGGNTIAGDDYLHNKQGGCVLFGDAETMSEDATGGNDKLSGSRFAETLYGDAREMADTARCGDDVLLGGRGNDMLWGDAEMIGADVVRGADRFVFAAASGRDVIGDFQQNIDLIDVQRLGYTAIGQLGITDNGTDSVVHFQGANQVTVLGVTGLTAADFLFA